MAIYLGGTKVSGSGGSGNNHLVLSKKEYEELQSIDPNVVYMLSDDVGSGGDMKNHQIVTREEYDALCELSTVKDDTIYLITDDSQYEVEKQISSINLPFVMTNNTKCQTIIDSFSCDVRGKAAGDITLLCSFVVPHSGQLVLRSLGSSSLSATDSVQLALGKIEHATSWSEISTMFSLNRILLQDSEFSTSDNSVINVLSGTNITVLSYHDTNQSGPMVTLKLFYDDTKLAVNQNCTIDTLSSINNNEISNYVKNSELQLNQTNLTFSFSDNTISTITFYTK